jgi:hypothetical protein
VTGCTTLQPVLQPVDFVTQKSPKYVLITTAELEDGEDPIMLSQPRIVEGALVGFDLYGESTRVPVSGIRVMRASQFNGRRTAFAVVGGAVIVGTIGFMIASQGKGIDNTYCPPPRCENFPH